MREMISFEQPTVVICHLLQDEMRAEATMTRMPLFQCLIDCQTKNLSPSGDFFRLNHSEKCELHGWFRIEDIVIDEVLEEVSAAAEDGEWQELEFIREAA